MVGWGCRLKPGFSVPVPARCERESCPERNPCPAHSDRWSLVEEGSTPVWAAAGWRGCRLGGECDESVASPLIISISPSLIRRPSPGSRREWVCERGGALKQPGLAACDEAHTWSEWSLITAAVICRVRLSSGDRSLPRACTLVSSWVQEGSVERGGPPPRDGWRARMPGRTPGSAAGPKEDEAADRSRRPRAPDLRGERVRPPDSAPYLDPSFQNTAPPSQPAQHDELTSKSPVYFGHFIPFGHFILLFLFNKSLSEAWRHAHCVCRLLLPPQYIYIVMFSYFSDTHVYHYMLLCL